MTDAFVGTCLTMYPLGALLDSTKNALRVGRPQYICPHSGPEGVVHGHVDAIVGASRILVPDTKILVGIGFDTWVEKVTAGECTVEDAVGEMLKACEVARAVGAVGVVVDPEGGSTGKGRAAGAAVAKLFLSTVRRLYPGLLVVHTSYDGPAHITYVAPDGSEHAFGFWGDYPWEEWCSDGASDVHAPQVYFAGGGPGSGPRRWQMHTQSWLSAQNAGRIGRAAQHGVYVQAHGCTVEDTCSVADECTFRMFWAANGDETFDAAGLTSFAAMCQLSRLGLTIREFQTRAALKVDGIVGNDTLRALQVV